MQPAAVVLLGKEPIPGEVKTRLAHRIGNTAAAQIQHHLTLACIQSLRPLNVPVIFQMSGCIDSTAANTYRQEGAIVEAQAVGTLTEKIHHASQVADRTLILGTDMPLLNLLEIRTALLAKEVVIGPAVDGGYWLIGGTHLPKSLLEDIPWSTPEVYEKTIAKCQQLGLHYQVLSRQYDIDTATELFQLLQDPRCPANLYTSLTSILDGLPPNTYPHI